MSRSPKTRPPPIDVNRDKTLSGLVIKPPRQSSMTPVDERDDDDDDDDNNHTLRKLMARQPLNPSRSRSPSTTSLSSMVVDGRWKYRGNDDDQLRMKSMGIENLVRICHDIMKTTAASPARQEEKRPKSPSVSRRWPVVSLDRYKKLTDPERASLRRAQVFNLMTIVYEAVSTDASISELVRIWREASEHARHPRRPEPDHQPLISYEKAFEHLLRTPNDGVLQVAVHASLISTKSRSNLRRLGDKLGVDRRQFDIGTIRESFAAFQNFLQFLREQKLREKNEQQFIDTQRLPYKRKRKQGLSANVSDTKFRLICQAVDVSGFDIGPNSDFTCNLLWNDTLISTDIVSALKPYQKVNHFPTMNEISRKDLLAKNYDRVRGFLPKDYNFAPKTWTLPSEYNLWYSFASNQPKKDSATYIMKPTNTAMGEGIAIHCDYKQVKKMENYIVQEYIREPYLLDGFKFDLRIYALVTSCDPLRVFIFNNGLVRMSSTKYEIPTAQNAFNLSMHLTNYFTAPIDENDLGFDKSKKSSLKFLYGYLKDQNHDVDKLWAEIKNIVIKTIFLAAPHMLTAYRTCRSGALPTSESVCFELLGFDILIDKNLKPWIIEVNRCPSFDTSEQLEFDLKVKLLCDTFNLLHFQVSDREKSVVIEKAEAQRRLYLSLGKRMDDRTDPLEEMKEQLFLVRREQAREIFENRYCGGFVRLFPVDDGNRMNELMNILTKCFHVLYTNSNDLTWSMKYHPQPREEELLHKIAQWKNEHKRLTTSNAPGLYRASSATCFMFELADDRKESPTRSPRSTRTGKSASPSTRDSFAQGVSTQTPLDIARSTSASSLKTKKRRTNALVSTGHISRPEFDAHTIPPGVSASRITEKKFYSTPEPPSEHADQQRPTSAKVTRSNHKSQMVTYASIIQATRAQQLLNQATSTAAAIDMTKELQLSNSDLNRLNELILDEMNKLRIHHPHRSDQEIYRICSEIMENWVRYKSDVGRFWLVELDATKRQAVIDIVRNNIQQIMKKLCIVSELASQLPLNRHLTKIERRLLANHGQCMWETCQNRHNSWELLFNKSNNGLSDIEWECCYRFVDLCKEALLIVYQYSLDEKFQKQKRMDQSVMFMVKS